MKCFLGISDFLEEISFFPLYCFTLFLSISHWERLSYLFLLFFGTVHSNGYISFYFSFAFRFSSIQSYLLRPPQTTILSFCISFPCEWSWSLPPVLIQTVFQSSCKFHIPTRNRVPVDAHPYRHGLFSLILAPLVSIKWYLTSFIFPWGSFQVFISY